jgi:NTP pyrophosphatase (non-canonical NTP hydrolase)
MSEPLTFARFAEANRSRCRRWHPGFPDDNAWTGADWSNAMCGEAGEAANVVKKLRRLETGAAPGPDDPPADELRAMLADEIADVIAYTFLLAEHYGVDVAAATAAKFNRVSARQGFPERVEP